HARKIRRESVRLAASALACGISCRERGLHGAVSLRYTLGRVRRRGRGHLAAPRCLFARRRGVAGQPSHWLPIPALSGKQPPLGRRSWAVRALVHLGRARDLAPLIFTSFLRTEKRRLPGGLRCL